MTMSTQTEIERKYEVDEKAMLPRFDGLEPAGVLSAMPAGEFDLAAEYFDTAGGDLAAHRITLRKRSGGSDDGWHLKLPSGDARTELRWPLDTAVADGPVPSVVLDPVLAIVRDRPLAPIARIGTRRSVIHLRGADDTGLVEIADDTVTASDVATGVVRIWREWEAELLPGADGRASLLDAVEERLRSAGARPASSASKLATALGRTDLGRTDLGRTDLGRTEEGTAPVAPNVGKGDAASDVLLVAVAALVREMVELDPLVRRDEPDSVHQLRTRVRRLRSILATYRRVFDATDDLRDRLSAFGTVLGQARDAEVMRDRAGALVDAHDEVPRAVRGTLVGSWDDEHSRARDAVTAELSSERYFRLLDALDDVVARPPLGDDARAHASEVLRPALLREVRRVLKRAKRAAAVENEFERIPLLHETRKAAKRLRYAAEAVSEGDAAVLGKRVRAVADAAESVHDLLGEHRDSVMLQEHLRATATRSGHAFDYGVLHELERHSAALCLADYRGALGRLKKRGRKL